ncbi:MAG: DUF1365 family protein, partial [Alphaproteobacteria bacterium]
MNTSARLYLCTVMHQRHDRYDYRFEYRLFALLVDIDRIDEIERETKHDVIAFLTWVAEQVGEEARFMHQGMTSSDV